MAIGFNLGASYGNLQVCPDRNLARKTKPRTLMAKFGDGYEQRIVDGINNLQETYTVTFRTREPSEIDDIVAFFDSGAGVTPFDYTIKDTNAGGERTIKVVCDDYGLTYTNDIAYSCSATFRRVYEP